MTLSGTSALEIDMRSDGIQYDDKSRTARNYIFNLVANIALVLQQWLYFIHMAMDVNKYDSILPAVSCKLLM